MSAMILGLLAWGTERIGRMDDAPASGGVHSCQPLQESCHLRAYRLPDRLARGGEAQGGRQVVGEAMGSTGIREGP